MEQPLISIIIPAYNEGKYINRCLESLLAQSYKSIEIIVIDDGSSDRTPDIVKKYPVRLFKKNHGGPGAARNFGAIKAKGSILVFLDADMEFPEEFIGELVKPIIVEGAVGTLHVEERVANPENILAKIRGKLTVNDFSMAYRAVKKDIFMQVGGFDLEGDYCDDRSLYPKINIPPKVVTSAYCYHRHAKTFKEVFHQEIWRKKSEFKNEGLSSKLLKAIIATPLLCVAFIVIVADYIIIATVFGVITLSIGMYGTIRYKDIRAIYAYPLYLLTILLASYVALYRVFFFKGGGTGK